MTAINIVSAQLPANAGNTPSLSALPSTIKAGSWSAWAINKTVAHHASPSSWMPNLVAKVISRFFINAEEAAKFLGTDTKAAAFLLNHWGGDAMAAQAEAMRIVKQIGESSTFKGLANTLPKQLGVPPSEWLVPLEDSNNFCELNIKLQELQKLLMPHSRPANKFILATAIQLERTFSPLDARYKEQFRIKSSSEVIRDSASSLSQQAGNTILSGVGYVGGAIVAFHYKALDILADSWFGDKIGDLMLLPPGLDD